MSLRDQLHSEKLSKLENTEGWDNMSKVSHCQRDDKKYGKKKNRNKPWIAELELELLMWTQFSIYE